MSVYVLVQNCPSGSFLMVGYS